MQKSYHAHEEYREVMSKSSVRVIESAIIELNWTPSSHNTYKINWDVVIDKTQCRAGTGVIFRDWEVR